MIAACPKCQTKYRIRAEKLGPDGARLRCSRCSAVFRVQRPADAPPSAPGAGRERQNLVLIADGDVEAGKATAGLLADWGLQAILVHDGVEAMLTVQRMQPRALILQATLPKMLGSQVCEVVKRNESLRSIGVVLLDPGRTSGSDPGNFYGADAYLERAQLAEALPPVLRKLGFAPRESSDAAPAAPTRPAPPTPPSTPATGAVAAGGELEDEREQARRLARIIVSDIVLYNPDKFNEAVRAGNVVDAMDELLEEGRTLFAERVDARIRAETDYLIDELQRVAKERAGP